MKPSPPYYGLLLASTGKLQAYLTRDKRASPYNKSDSDLTSSDEDMIQELKTLNIRAAAAEHTNEIFRRARKDSASSTS
jgi:CTP synthase